MKQVMAVAGAAILFAASGAHAQDVQYWPAPKPSAGEGRMYYVPMGTPLTLMTRTLISSQENKIGDRVYLQVVEPIVFRGQIVIPAGATAVGEVSSLQRNGHLGRKGKLTVRLDHVETPHGPVRLAGSGYDEGKSGTAAALATIALAGVAGFLVHGTSARIEPNTVVDAVLGEQMNFYWYPQAPEFAAASIGQAPARAVPDRFDPSVFSAARPSGQR